MKSQELASVPVVLPNMAPWPGMGDEPKYTYHSAEILQWATEDVSSQVERMPTESRIWNPWEPLSEDSLQKEQG